MQSMLMRIFLMLATLSLLNPPSLLAAAEQRIALVIGNSTYSSGPLKNPVNDANDMAATLQRLGYKVNLKKNANLETMEEAIEDFGNRLKRGGVGLFYYAGHGVQVNGINYLIPVDAKINKESDVRFKAVDAGRVLAEMENANNGVNIVLLDACRDNPFGKSFRSASRGLAIVSNSPSGTFISYSTGPGQVARDGEGRNSPYTKALLENMVKPGLTINSVFMKVRSKVKKETGQVPWELSSLEGDFFFVPGAAGSTATVKNDSSEVKSSAADELDEEKRKLEAERRRLEAEKESFEKTKALSEKRRTIEDERERKSAKRAGATLAQNITGKWFLTIVTSKGSGNPVVTFKQDGEKITGRYAGSIGEAPLTGTLKGNDLVFQFITDPKAGPVIYTGEVTDPKKISGTVDFAGKAKGTWEGKKIR